jgi:hypothetical protein
MHFLATGKLHRFFAALRMTASLRMTSIIRVHPCESVAKKLADFYRPTKYFSSRILR